MNFSELTNLARIYFRTRNKEMKEQYNKLLRHSSMQQKKIDSMQKTMEQIVTNLGALSKVVDKIDGIGGKVWWE